LASASPVGTMVVTAEGVAGSPNSNVHANNKGWTTGFHHTHMGSPGFGPAPALPAGRRVRSPSPNKVGALGFVPIWQRELPTRTRSPAEAPGTDRAWMTGFQNHSSVGAPTFPSPPELAARSRSPAHIVTSPGGLAYVA
jgi:hypothetical protein